MGRAIKQTFGSLEEELNHTESLLAKEREIERNLFLEKESESGSIKSAELVDLRFLVGNTWRAEFQVILSNKSKLWLKPGVPVLLQNQNESIYGNVYQWKESKLIIQVRGDYDWESEDYTISKWFPESTYDLYNEIIGKVRNETESESYKKLKWCLGYGTGDKPTPPKKQWSYLQ